MKTIYKYPIAPFPTSIKIHYGYVALSVQMQNGKPYLWALVDTDQPLVVVETRVYGTGHAIDKSWNGNYLGTFQVDDLVFHAFINPNPSNASDNRAGEARSGSSPCWMPSPSTGETK